MINDVLTALPLPLPLPVGIALLLVALLRSASWNPLAAVAAVGHGLAVVALAVWFVVRLAARHPMAALAAGAAVLLAWLLAPAVSALPGTVSLWVLGGVGVLVGGAAIAYAVIDNARCLRETVIGTPTQAPGYQVPAWVEDHR